MMHTKTPTIFKNTAIYQHSKFVYIFVTITNSHNANQESYISYY